MSLKFIILGSGSSMGVPRADGYAGKCNLANSKNFRTRCCALIQFEDQNILIDTSPDLRFQLLKNKIRTIDRVFYSHLHADQTHGINDLRPFFYKIKIQFQCMLISILQNIYFQLSNTALNHHLIIHLH